MSLDFIRHLCELRAANHLELGRGTTELGWSNALTITLQQFGIPAELVEGKSKAYRQVAPPHPNAYAEDFTFACVKLPGEDPLNPVFADWHGNAALPDIARAAAQDRHWVYDHTAIVHHRGDNIRNPDDMSPETAATIRYVVGVMSQALADFRAQQIAQATPQASSTRSVRL